MSVRMKLTHSKTASRRAHHKKSVPHLVATTTGSRRRHFMDPDTGMYRGKQIIMIGKPIASKSDKVGKKGSNAVSAKVDTDKGSTAKDTNIEKN